MSRSQQSYRGVLDKLMKSVFVVLLATLALPISLSATHIVGGEITYRCLGNDTYEVKVAVYRDCINGSALAVYDDPASVGIFDANNNLQIHLGQFGQLLIPFNADDTLSQFTDCIDGLGGVCVQQTFYIDTIQLPFIPGGYQLVYQRCCRNQTLVNIVEPLETGSSFVTTVTEDALTECNSTPEFREWPPIFICVNEEINYDHSAEDVDGDSLVYRLCAPLMGASREIPSPQPPRFPPYDEVIWAAPYNLDNLLGGTPLAIDENGQLTGTPNTIGQFLVGICVEEYRNGRLMSMTRRDFEYNVVDCDGLVFTDFSVDSEVICADVVDVQITDESIGLNSASVWSYIVTKDNGETLEFSGPNPSFRIDGTSSIVVTQNVIVDASCTTSKSQTIDLGVDGTGFSDGDTITICSGSSVQLNPFAPSQYEYSWSPTTYLDDPTNPNPISTPAESITYTVEIFDPVLNCTIEKSIHVQVVLVQNRIADFTVAKDCGSTTLAFTNTSIGDEGVFLWHFGDPANPDVFSTEENPTYTYPRGGTYVVSLTLPGDDCNAIRTKRLPVAGEDFKDFDTTILVCGPSFVLLNPSLNADYLYTWEANPYFSDLNNPTPDVFLDADATFNVTVVDPLNEDCVITGVVRVQVDDQLVVTSIGDTILSCTGINVPLNPEGDPNLIYAWSPENLVSDPTSHNPLATITEPTTFSVTITDPNDETCMVRFKTTVSLGLNPGGFEDGDSLVVCAGSSVFINTGADPNLQYNWSPAQDLDNPNLPNPISAPGETITYTVTITDPNGECTLTKSITIVVVESDVLLSFDINKECNSLTLDFINTSVGASSYEWTFGDPANPGFVSTEENPTYTYASGGTYEVQLSSNDDPNCTAYRARRILVLGEEFQDFERSVYVCGPSFVLLESPFSRDAIYEWAPNPYFGNLSDPRPDFLIDMSDSITLRVRAIDPLNEECFVDGIFRITVDTQLVVTSISDTILACMPGEVELNPNGDPALIYDWSPAELFADPSEPNPSLNVSETTTVTVRITDPNDPSCVVRFRSTILFADEFEIDILRSSPTDMACPGDDITLVARGDLFDSLSWTSPSGMPLGSGDSITFAITEDGTYQVQGFKDNCVYTDTFRLGVRSLIFTLDPDAPGCAGDPVRITVTSNSDFLFDSILWLPAEDISLGQGSESVVVRPDATQSYVAMMFFEDGCMVLDSVTVPVSDIDDRFEVIADPDTIFFGEETTLMATNEVGATYQWTPTDDLQTPGSSSTVAIPPQTTTYTVDITDMAGCTTSKQVTVTVIMVNCQRPDIFLPNAFSPNGDGQNDILFVRGLYLEEVDLIVFNRWGQKVFETNNQNSGWDGTFNGQQLEPDVYGYHLRVRCIGGDQHIEKGNITILR
ncbi:MAG: gliding motility-associated C-terminal domain-containing protein [Saprospiraceae bacterium]|nr:gliding motility-associated C-terminal domain-containing protein [Saprospiraceae bacterium]